jgi:hypothetical protein|tara:strand:+ start:75 stop:398 length:324 start_codon:yes stop_codon:yes gene_type:complete
MDVAEIDILIALSEIESNKIELRNYHKGVYSNPAEREIERLTSLKVFYLTEGIKVEQGGSGCIIVNDKFEYALITGKWRALGKSKWYRSKSPKSFIFKYVFDNKEGQ